MKHGVGDLSHLVISISFFYAMAGDFSWVFEGPHCLTIKWQHEENGSDWRKLPQITPRQMLVARMTIKKNFPKKFYFTRVSSCHKSVLPVKQGKHDGSQATFNRFEIGVKARRVGATVISK